MTSFFLTIIILLINGLSVLRFYQLKNYLYKRVIAHFYLPSSKRIIFNLKEYFLYCLFFLSSYLFWFKNSKNFDFLSKLDFLIFLTIFLLILRINLIKRINFTPKVLLISVLAFLINLTFIALTQNSLLTFSFLSLWLVQFSIFTISISIFNISVKPYLLFLGNLAKKKIDKVKKTKGELKIVGIVGSYGKSTTKEFLSKLLAEKYKVLTPPPRINHEYALLKFILKTKIKDYDYLILEFGSYYLGNIKWITKFITPDIAYITGITKQHLFLFGNIENIMIGEGLEILSWMKKGILLINSNHEYFESLDKKIKDLNLKRIKIYTYGLKGNFSYQIKENNLEGVVFEFKTNNKRYLFKTKIIFPTQIENICGALAYISLIDDPKNYSEIIKKLKLPDGFLKLKIKENIYLFNDSYNANLRGVFESLKFFKSLKLDYKIVIFNDLFELGKETKEVYKTLKEEFLNFDKIILTSNNFFEILKEENLPKEKFLLIKKNNELEILLQSLKKLKVGIWIFNRLPENLNVFREN